MLTNRDTVQSLPLGEENFSFSEYELHGSEKCRNSREKFEPQNEIYVVLGQWGETGHWELSLKYAL